MLECRVAHESGAAQESQPCPQPLVVPTINLAKGDMWFEERRQIADNVAPPSTLCVASPARGADAP